MHKRAAWPTLVAFALVLVCSGTAVAPGAPGALAIRFGAAARPARALKLPVPPPPGASASRPAVTPAGRIGSGYLHVRVWTYRVPMVSSSVFAYYSPKLAALGYRTAGEGYSGGPMGTTSYQETYARGQDTLFLTVLPDRDGVTRYSVALDRVELPGRPAASLVPRGVRILQVAVRYGQGRWRRRTIRSAAEIAPILKIVDSLGVYDPGGRLGCLGVQRTAILSFSVEFHTYTFSEQASCLLVAAPGGIDLSDTNRMALWQAAERVVRVRETARPAAHG